MGRCARRTKKGIKRIAKSLTPVGVKLIGMLVGIAEDTEMSGMQKRRMVVAAGKAALGDAKENAIRAAVALAVDALTDGRDALADLGDLDDADVEEVEALA